MTPYDSHIIQQMADALYKRARGLELWMSLTSAIRWGLAVAAIGGGVAAASSLDGDWQLFGGGVAVASGGLGAMLGAVSGFRNGRTLAFTLRLDAQRALCSVQMEQHLAKLADGR